MYKNEKKVISGFCKKHMQNFNNCNNSVVNCKNWCVTIPTQIWFKVNKHAKFDQTASIFSEDSEQ